MKLFKTILLLLLSMMCASAYAFAQEAAPVQKKIIQVGWDMPDTAILRKNQTLMEDMPFDGVILRAFGKDSTGKIVAVSTSTFSDEPWKQEWFQSSVNDLKEIHSKKLTDNFIRAGASPGNVDWFDDAGWARIAEHMRIVAWIAREGNLKGIVFDPEAYNRPIWQFRYAAQPQRDQHTFEEYQAKARQRGREVISAVAAVDPNLVFFTFFMNSTNAVEAHSTYPHPSLQGSDYGLYPAFINGWLDAAPPSMIFVDGCEVQGYRGNSQLDFLQTADNVRNTALNLVAPENRLKYLTQVQTSFGLFLDAYTNPPTDSWYIDPKGSTPVQRLQINTRYAADTASEYVWIYGQNYRWWPTGNSSVNPQSWEEAMPGIDDALQSATRPQQVAQRKLAELEKDGKLVNLLKNGDFSAAKSTVLTDKNTPSDWKNEGAPANWSFWQSSDPLGIFSLDNSVNHSGQSGGSARIAGTNYGCFIQAVDVKPGESYMVRGWLRQAGNSNGWIRVGWQTAEGKWTERWSDKIIVAKPSSIPDHSWQLLEDVVNVPANAEKLVVTLYTGGQRTPQDVAWYDDVQVYQVS